MPDFAHRVVIDRDNGKMTVDGDDFPWYISEDGPEVHRIQDSLYTVAVNIFAHEGFTLPGEQKQPIIAGREFPWYITEDGIVLTSTRTTLPMLTLAFLAEGVEDPELVDDREMYAFNGDRVRHKESTE